MQRFTFFSQLINYSFIFILFLNTICIQLIFGFCFFYFIFAFITSVQRAKGLLTKGKNGTNNCFVTIGLGKEKYQTSVKEKSACDIDWHEECEL